MCIIGFLVTSVAYAKAREKNVYEKNMHNFMNDLRRIRLACRIKRKSKKVKYQMEEIPASLKKLVKVLEISEKNLHPKINLSDYI